MMQSAISRLTIVVVIVCSIVVTKRHILYAADIVVVPSLSKLHVTLGLDPALGVEVT